MNEPLADHLGRNIKQLRDARGATQLQMAKLSGLPRATWANLESGAANPTLSVLHRVAVALAVSIEELLSPSRAASVRLHPRESLPVRTKGTASLRKLLPDAIPAMELDRMELPARARITGVPHTQGTREYLTCEVGEILLSVGGERLKLREGDVASFRGDQRHGYENPGTKTAIGYSVVVLAPLF